MSLRAAAGKALFVFLCVILSISLVYLAAERVPQTYTASLEFGVASSDEKAKPDFLTEKNLLLSDEILLQVMRELNLLPASTSRFRSFDLGNAKTPITDSNLKTTIAAFRKGFGVVIDNEASLIKIIYTDRDSPTARKTLEVLFEKYRDWRQDSAPSDFDDRSIEADKEIAEKREIFLQSQQRILSLIEGDKNSSDALQSEKTALDAKISALKLRYGPKHPALIEALKQRSELDVKNTKQVETGQVLQLKKKLEVDFKNLDEAMRKSVMLEQQKSTIPSAIKILPMGDVIVQNSNRYLPHKIAAASLLAFMLALIYLQIRSRSNFGNADNIKSILGFDSIATIPGLDGNGELPMPSGEMAEKLKVLRQELKLLSSEKPIKLITVTSTDQGECVTALVAGLGRLSARSGENVIIIDADLRRPDLQQALPQNSARNLVDYLSGQARIEDIIYKTDVSGVHVIYGTAVPNTALDLISSEKMKTLLQSLREVYDLTLLAAPSSEAGPDARILSQIGDRTLYCLNTGKTSRKQAINGLSGFNKTATSVVLIQN